MADDTLRQTPEVIEAVRRLPADTYNQRAFRIKRALDLSLKHRILPSEQWTKFEEVSGSDFFSRLFPFRVIEREKGRERGCCLVCLQWYREGKMTLH